MSLVSVEVLEPTTLDEWARIANEEHEAVGQAVLDTLTHAIRAGEALLAAREAVPKGTWLRWLAENFRGSRSLGMIYMRLASRQAELKEHEFTTMRAARRYLDREALGQREQKKILRAEVRHLFKMGEGVGQLAAEFDVSPSTIQRWLMSDADRKYRDMAVNRRRKQAMLALERQSRDRAVAKVGRCDVADAYSGARRLAQTLERAARREDNEEARRALEDGLRKLYAVEDEIVRALGVTRPDLNNELFARNGRQLRRLNSPMREGVERLRVVGSERP